MSGTDEEATTMNGSVEETAGNGPLEGAVVAVAGAAGPAGRATLLRLAE
ncbi:short-chain dehydrogenase, partial [Streptomyces sp. SID5475]|nr:short-chain dehydrogenase [Streptomyces sp. SID5475]